MTTDSVTRSRRLKREDLSQVPAKVETTASHAKSKRGFDWDLYFALCPGCGERRTFTKPGDRLCACGQRLHLIVTAEVGG